MTVFIKSPGAILGWAWALGPGSVASSYSALLACQDKESTRLDQTTFPDSSTASTAAADPTQFNKMSYKFKYFVEIKKKLY